MNFKNLLLSSLLASLLSSGSSAQAEGETKLGEGNRNEIRKWCKEGSAERYTSANLTVQGYQSCGTLSVSQSCDASGQRFISPSNSPAPHYSYKDCNLGPRIVLEKSSESNENQQEKDTLKEEPFLENDSFARQKTKKKIEKTTSSEYLSSLDKLLSAPQKFKSKPQQANNKKTQRLNKILKTHKNNPQVKTLQNLLKQVSPEQQQMIEQVIKNSPIFNQQKIEKLFEH